ncbi:hypothetical protein AB1L88_01675 [Tautonia sp. JC769]|uniref:WD40 repeat domain-containing protein n=1 Tax=Tautonia sp. JC769 TaxID=3232135 RepID=UPI0034591071
MGSPFCSAQIQGEGFRNKVALPIAPPRKLSEGAIGRRRWYDVAISPDGTFIAAVGEDSTQTQEALVWLWDAESGLGLRTFSGFKAPIMAVAFGPEGRRIAAGGIARWREVDRGLGVTSVAEDGSVMVWDVQSRHEILHLSQSIRPMRAGVAVGREVVSIIDEEYGCRFSRLEDAQTIFEMTAPSGSQKWGGISLLRRVSFSRDAAKAVVIARGAPRGMSDLLIYDLKSRRPRVHRIGAAACVALSPDGSRFVTAGRSGTLVLHDFETLDGVRTFDGLARPLPLMMEFSPDGRHVASGDDSGLVHVWSVRTGQTILTVQGPGMSTRALTFLPEGRLRVVSGGIDPGDDRDPDTGLRLREPLMVWEADLEQKR